MVVKFFTTAALAVAVSASASFAQSSRSPAEMPPASYTGSQYVDSNGCVFIRAGFNGSTTWVPRYGDNRRPMCGFQPSNAAGAATVAQAQPRATAPAPVTVAAPARATAPRRTAPRAASREIVTVDAPVQVRGRTVVRRAPAVRTETYSAGGSGLNARARQEGVGGYVYQAQAGPLDRRWSFADRTGPSPCTNYSAHSQMYAVPSPANPSLPLRCGPQAQHPADALREQSPNGGRWEPWDGANPYPAPNNNVYMVPPPYAPRWPQPYLNGANYQPRAVAPATRRAPRATVSTMGTRPTVARPVARAAAAASGRMSNGQYVQVGTYGQPGNVRNAVARLQRQGLPVATSRVRSSGRQLQVVLAGPFNSQAELNTALRAARAMGYSDAFVR